MLDEQALARIEAIKDLLRKPVDDGKLYAPENASASDEQVAFLRRALPIMQATTGKLRAAWGTLDKRLALDDAGRRRVASRAKLVGVSVGGRHLNMSAVANASDAEFGAWNRDVTKRVWRWRVPSLFATRH